MMTEADMVNLLKKAKDDEWDKRSVEQRETVSNLSNNLNENSTPTSSAEVKLVPPSDFFYSSTMNDSQIDLNVVG